MSPTVARSRDPEKDDCSKEEMAVATDAAALVDGKGGAGVGQAELELQGGWGSGWAGSRIGTGWNLSWVALSCGLNIEPESTVNLAFVKNDSYEKGPDSVVVHVYVKEIRRDTSQVLFREQDFTLIFQTRWVGGQTWGRQCASGRAVCLTLFLLPCPCRDGNFLRLHPGCGPHTIFRWQVKLRWVVPSPAPLPVLLPCSPCPWAVWPPEALSAAFPCRNLIEPEQCTFCFTASRIDICLRKRQNQRWGGLEAPAARGLPTSSFHCLVLGTRTPTPCHMLLTTSPPFPLFKVQWVVQRSPCRQVHPPWIQPHREVHPIP